MDRQTLRDWMHRWDGSGAKSLHIMIIDEAMAAEKPQPGMPLALVTDHALVRRALLVMPVDRCDAVDQSGGGPAGREHAQAGAVLPWA